MNVFTVVFDLNSEIQLLDKLMRSKGRGDGVFRVSSLQRKTRDNNNNTKHEATFFL